MDNALIKMEANLYFKNIVHKCSLVRINMLQ
jgi:hypothetical protein